MANPTSQTDAPKPAARSRNSRRSFLRTAGGMAAGTALFVAGCDSGESIPTEQELTAGGLSVSGVDDDDLMVTFTVGMEGRTSFPARVQEARIEISNGAAIDLMADDVNPGDSVDYTFDEAGNYSAVLVTEGDFRGQARSGRVRFSVGGAENPVVTLDFSSPVGVLNYAYALEQLEAAFYERAVQAIDDGDLSVNGMVGQYMSDLAAHEGIHRDFLNTAISANGGTPQELGSFLALEDVVDFSNASQVLATAQTLEDTGVAAYNGAGIYLSGDFRTLAGKIVSVEARHASAIRSINGDATAFADLDDLTDLNANTDFSLGVAAAPQDVLDAVAATGLVTGVTINASNTVSNPSTD